VSKYPYEIDNDKLWIGDARTAANPSCLEAIKITHILNLGEVACFWRTKEALVEAGYPNYDPPTYMRTYFSDESSTKNIRHLLQPCLDFIRSALQEDDGRVLIHCVHGKTRSVAIALAWFASKGRVDVDAELKKIQTIVGPEAQPRGNFLACVKEFAAGLFPTSTIPVISSSSRPPPSLLWMEAEPVCILQI